MQEFCNVIPVLVIYKSTERMVDIKDVLEKLSNLFNCVIVVDNDLTDRLRYFYQCIPTVSYIHNGNRGGLAGAYNSAVTFIEKNRPRLEYILFLDDDTRLSDIYLSGYLERLISIQRQHGAIAVTGRYRDVNSETYCNFVRLRTWSYKRVISCGQPEQVTFIINSMSLWSYKDLITLGRFNEELMVDHVDSEICLRASEKGFKVFADYSLVFNHEIGRRLSYSLFGFKLNSGNHGVERRFLIGMGTAYLLRSRLLSWPAVSLFMFERAVYEILGILLVERNKYNKLCAFIKGFYYGIIVNYAELKKPK